ncbi:MAG: hypothetical protein L0Z49_12730 [Actinobacteria bacterium]|nr:hypothetical protein [Actinomycetota bacterium]
MLSLVLLALIASACSSPAYGRNIGPDPISLRELGGLGGASLEPLDPTDAAARSELAMEIEVVDIKRTTLNTPDGRFPSADQLEKLGISDLSAGTDVVVRVRDFLGSSREDLAFDEGSLVTLTIGGGRYDTVIDNQQAQLLGMTEVVDGSSAEHNEGETATPDVEVEVPVVGDSFEVSWGHSPVHSFSEGDVLILFLVEFQAPGYDRGPLTLLGPIHPSGVLVKDGDGWKVEGGDAQVDVNALVEALGSDVP